MEKSPLKKYLTPKFLSLGIFVLLLISVILVMVSGSSETKVRPANPTPTEPPNTETLPSTPPDKEISGQIIVKFKSGYSDAQINEHLKLYKASILKKIEGINYTVVKVPQGKEEEILEKLKDDPYVEKAIRDYSTHITFIPNDPNYTLQYGLKNKGQTIQNSVGIVNDDVKAETAWDVTRGAGIKVAILDTGINLSHPELAGKVVVQHVFTTTSIEDNNGHGTHVAGILAANTNNGQGIAGTCPECQLIIGKIMDDGGTGTTSDAASGITWAADQGAKVINLSIRTTTASSAPFYQTAIDYANSKGAVVVVAAGNDASTASVWPAANTGVVSVASTDNRDRLSSFSNRGTWVKIAAPGSTIYSTLPNHANARNTLNYGYLSGTSMASPLVAGVIALIWTTPYATSNTAVINRLYTTADKIDGTGTSWTEGRVNAAKAVASAPTVAIVTPENGGVPSPACVGGVGAPPCATIPPSANATPLPTVALPNESIVPTNTVPSNPNPTSVIDPCLGDAATSIQARKKHKRHSHVKHAGFLQRFIEFLLRLLEQIFKMFGVQLPLPTPTPMPIPTGTEPNPTTPPGENPNENPTPTPCAYPTESVPTISPPGVTITAPESGNGVILP